MHELSVARAIVQEVESSAFEHGFDTVTCVRLRIGRLSGIVADAVQFGFGIARVDTVCEHATLEIDVDPVIVWCPDGEHTVELGESEHLVFRCPEHGCATPEVLGGEDLLITGYDSPDVGDLEHVASGGASDAKR